MCAAPPATRLGTLVAAIAPMVVATGAVACPPPPPPLPTWEEQAHTFWNRVDTICLLRLERSGLRPSELPEPVRITAAAGHWQVPATPFETWKGDCRPRVVHFANIPAVMCGAGMPPLDTMLLAGFGHNGLLTVWTPAEGELATALRALKRGQRP